MRCKLLKWYDLWRGKRRQWRRFYRGLPSWRRHQCLRLPRIGFAGIKGEDDEDLGDQSDWAEEDDREKEPDEPEGGGSDVEVAAQGVAVPAEGALAPNTGGQERKAFSVQQFEAGFEWWEMFPEGTDYINWEGHEYRLGQVWLFASDLSQIAQGWTPLAKFHGCFLRSRSWAEHLSWSCFSLFGSFSTSRASTCHSGRPSLSQRVELALDGMPSAPLPYS